MSTSCAVGVFDKEALDLISIVPMKYKWLKKINSDYADNKTNSSANDKIRRFIKLY